LSKTQRAFFPKMVASYKLSIHRVKMLFNSTFTWC